MAYGLHLSNLIRSSEPADQAPYSWQCQLMYGAKLNDRPPFVPRWTHQFKRLRRITGVLSVNRSRNEYHTANLLVYSW